MHHNSYILFTKLPWPGDSDGNFLSWSQDATYPPVYHTQWSLYTVPLIAERHAGKLPIPIILVFGLTPPRIESMSIVSVADAILTRPMIDRRHLGAKPSPTRRFCNL